MRFRIVLMVTVLALGIFTHSNKAQAARPMTKTEFWIFMPTLAVIVAGAGGYTAYAWATHTNCDRRDAEGVCIEGGGKWDTSTKLLAGFLILDCAAILTTLTWVMLDRDLQNIERDDNRKSIQAVHMQKRRLALQKPTFRPILAAQQDGGALGFRLTF